MLARIHRLCPGDLNRRIIEAIRARIQAGEITERRLARLTNWSQPHISNVLAGHRKMSGEMGDSLVQAMRLRPLELYGEAQLLDWAAGIEPPFHRPPAAIAAAAA